MKKHSNTADIVTKYYNKYASEEWNRLTIHQLEYIISMYYIEKNISKHATILDVGGGPGRYSIALAKKGHCVHLVDLSPENIKLAIKKQQEEKVQLASTHVGNVLDLCNYADSQFDVVLVMGPLYHLKDEKERKRAIQESMRVLKKGGLFVVSSINKYSNVYYNLKYNLQLKIPIPVIRSILMGSAIPARYYKKNINNSFYDFLFHTSMAVSEPLEIKKYMSSFRLKEKLIVGAEGLAAGNEFTILKEKSSVKKEWIKLMIDIAPTIASQYASEHVLYFGTKK